MKVTKTNAELNALLTGLGKIADSKATLSTKVGYAVITTRTALQNALKPYDEMRKKIIHDNSGGAGQINAKDNPDGFKAAMAAFAEIDDEKTEVDIHTITWDMLGEEELPLDVMMALGFMIVDKK